MSNQNQFNKEMFLNSFSKKKNFIDVKISINIYYLLEDVKRGLDIVIRLKLNFQNI